MEPGSISDLGESFERVFRVKFAGAVPPPGQRYWRGPVLSYTDGKRWTQAAFQKSLLKPVVTGTPYQYTLLMEPQDKNWIFALDMPQGFSAPLTQNAAYQLVTSESSDKRAEYKVTSYADYNTGSISPSEYKAATQLPGEPSDKIKQLVGQLHGFDSAPDDFINRLLKHFRVEDFHYTLTPPVMEENPVESFFIQNPLRILQPLRLRLRLFNARRSYSGARRDRLSGRRTEQRRRFPGDKASRRPCLGRSLAGEPRLGSSRSHRGHRTGENRTGD